MPPAVAEAPSGIRYAPCKAIDKKGNLRDLPGSMMIVGVPGGPPGEQGIILVKPIVGVPKGEVMTLEENGQTYLRGWHTEKHFDLSVNFPEGLMLGYIDHYTDTGIGQPFVEKSVCQVGPDAEARLEAFANDDAFLTMPERRKLAKATQRYMAENAVGVRREDTTTPKQALEGVADTRLDDRIAKAVADALAAERVKKTAPAEPPK